MKKYKHLFFDIDRTLWDFDRSSYETLVKLFDMFELRKNGVPSFELFYKKYKEINLGLWDLYREGKIEKELLNIERFYQTICFFGFDNRSIAAAFGDRYVKISPTGDYLYPNTKEMLDYLFDRYSLHIITNGFEDVQQTKIVGNDLGKYFKTITTSEMVGAKKPSPGIFEFALKQAGANASESLMIGDDIEVDLVGARNIGIDQMLVNFNGDPSCDFCNFQVKDLKSIIKIL